MIKDESSVETARKKTYVKPTISEVKLRPEEAVLGNCKIADSAGPLSGSCTSPTTCSTPGS